ncbi:type VI secretion system baseplate subunit TssK [Albimonas pacifica]|uniref:Type VI secretion system protein ImpJ n=1 Tax=Albimonas pacifica TaxID=1114924 RepID=A0A1I3CZQ2_9RHOB|nr:type VI secretion system baseplate subunit TssK [Albimonas pacifica]SFH79943.1 type VI secretion system protein ImpJ [Albimonas pacifica]
MSWESKVLWSEGLFLQPHHFQQHDRYVEALVAGLASGVAPYAWGVRELTLDEALLKLGKIAVKSCTGLTQDGAVFRVPAVDEHPPALDVPEQVKNAVVYLAVPSRRHGAAEVDLSGDPRSAARYLPAEIDVADTMGRERRPFRLAVAKLRMSFALDLDDLSDQLVIPIARIIEVRPDREVVLDRAFVPACTDARAAPALHAFLRELEGMLAHRAGALAGRLTQSGAAKGVAEIADYLLLISLNRALPQIRQILGIENAHPQEIHRFLAGLAGELSSFMAADKLPDDYPAYRHHDLTNTFQPLFRALRQFLSSVLEQNAVAIPIEPRKYGVSVAQIADRRLLTSSTFVLAAKADVPAESVRRYFPSQAKLGPVEEIRQLVNSALPGIGLRPLPVAPRQIPFHAGSVYFELEADSPYWRQMTTSGGMAVHVSGEFPGLSMELWAVRNAG